MTKRSTAKPGEPAYRNRAMVAARAAKPPSKKKAVLSALPRGKQYEGPIPPGDPIARLEGEGDLAYKVFTEYAVLPPSQRTLALFIGEREKVPKELRGGGTDTTIRGWHHTWRWAERLMLWDAIQHRRDVLAAADEDFDARKRRRLVASQALRVADLMVEHLLDSLEDPILRRLLRVGVKDVANFIKVATDLSRTEHSEEGVPTTRVIVEEGDALDRATPEELAALLRKSIAERVGEVVLSALADEANGIIEGEARVVESGDATGG